MTERIGVKKVLVLCPYPERVAPSQRLKYEQYFGYLRQSGYEIVVSPFQTMAMWRIVFQRGRLFSKVIGVIGGYLRRALDLFRIPFYDGVYVSLNVTPLGPPLFERAVRLLARGMIYDIDDLVFLNRTSDVNRLASKIKGTNKPLYLMKHADHVITCTPYLDSFARRLNPHTTDISSTIDTDVYVPKTSYANEHRLVLGWSGTFSNAPYLRLLDSVLVELRKRIDFKLLVIGVPDFKVDGLEVEVLPWREITEVADLSQIDIGLYPLPDEGWVYGKSGLKALQYMGLGIPTVATAIGTISRIIEDGVSGYLVRTPEEWLERLYELATAPDLRARLGKNGRACVEERFSIRANRDTYLRIFQEVYGQDKRQDSLSQTS